MSDDIVKISANLPKDTIDQLKWLAQERGTTMTEVIRRAVSHEAFFHDFTAKDGKILTEDRTGAMKQIIIK